MDDPPATTSSTASCTASRIASTLPAPAFSFCFCFNTLTKNFLSFLSTSSSYFSNFLSYSGSHFSNFMSSSGSCCKRPVRENLLLLLLLELTQTLERPDFSRIISNFFCFSSSYLSSDFTSSGTGVFCFAVVGFVLTGSSSRAPCHMCQSRHVTNPP